MLLMKSAMSSSNAMQPETNGLHGALFLEASTKLSGLAGGAYATARRSLLRHMARR